MSGAQFAEGFPVCGLASRLFPFPDLKRRSCDGCGATESVPSHLSRLLTFFAFLFSQTEIAKRLNAIIAQILPFLSQEHQQQVATAVERAKQVTMTELNAIIGVSFLFLRTFFFAGFS